MNWLKYPHIERLDSEEVEGLLYMSKLYIEPKIDGANASVFLDEGGQLQVAKRTQVLGAGDDMENLKKTIFEDSPRWQTFFKHYPAHIVYGEWLVKHTISWYRPTAYKQFYAFDLLNTMTGAFMQTEERVKIFDQFGILQVSPITVIKGPVISDDQKAELAKLLDQNKFLIDGPELGEGIVIKGFT